MEAQARATLWIRVLWLLVLLLPLLVMFFLPGAPLVRNGLWVWIVLLIALAAAWILFRPFAKAQAAPAPDEITPPALAADTSVIDQIMEVQASQRVGGSMVFRGRLLAPAAEAYQQLKAAFGPGVVPLLQQDDRYQAAVVLLSRQVEQRELEQPSRPWLNLLLFVLTLGTTTWAGAAHRGFNLLEEPQQFTAGLPYALGLILILGVHELGHYFTARYHRIRVSLPYFIPVPFALGTFGAFIQMKSPTEHRRALFDVAVAGPLAGLVVAVPALLLGLQQSEIVTSAEGGRHLISLDGTSVGSSVLLALLAKLALPEALQTGCTVRFSPLAFAGWLGILVTALNLLPIGQLDGGHMARGMLGSRLGSRIGSIAMWSLFLLALFVWPGLLVWAIIVFFIAGRGTPPLEDLTPVGWPRKLIGAFAFLLLVLILTPLPHDLLDVAGIYCPYL